VVIDYFLIKDLETAIGITFICLLEAMGLLVLCKSGQGGDKVYQ
jgi:hypothetical protein